MIDFSSLTPEAVLSIVAQSAQRTAGVFYHAADAFDALQDLSLDDRTSKAVGCMVALGALHTLRDGDTAKIALDGITQSGESRGDWIFEVHRHDLDNPCIKVPAVLESMDPQDLRGVLSEAINHSPGALLVDADSPLGTFEKHINGRPLNTLGQGLMHAACSLLHPPALHITKHAHLRAAFIGGTAMADIDLSLTRVR